MFTAWSSSIQKFGGNLIQTGPVRRKQAGRDAPALPYARAGTGPRPAVLASSPGSHLPRPPVPQGVSGAAPSFHRSDAVLRAHWPRELAVLRSNGRRVLLGIDVGPLVASRRAGHLKTSRCSPPHPPAARRTAHGRPCRPPAPGRAAAGKLPGRVVREFPQGSSTFLCPTHSSLSLSQAPRATHRAGATAPGAAAAGSSGTPLPATLSSPTKPQIAP
jgi:hypothetical protein